MSSSSRCGSVFVRRVYRTGMVAGVEGGSILRSPFSNTKERLSHRNMFTVETTSFGWLVSDTSYFPTQTHTRLHTVCAWTAGSYTCFFFSLQRLSETQPQEGKTHVSSLVSWCNLHDTSCFTSLSWVCVDVWCVSTWAHLSASESVFRLSGVTRDVPHAALPMRSEQFVRLGTKSDLFSWSVKTGTEGWLRFELKCVRVSSFGKRWYNQEMNTRVNRGLEFMGRAKIRFDHSS